MEVLRELLESPGVFGGRNLQEVELGPLILMLLMSLAAALLVAYLYLRFYGGRETGSQIHRSFPLLGISITAIFICVQFSLPLSLGLLGALSIVRFRTPIKEPEEIGFLMVVIASSLACATFNLRFLGLVLLVALLAILVGEAVFRLSGHGTGTGAIVVALKESDYQSNGSKLLDGLSRSLPRGRLESVSKSGEDVIVTYAFRRLDPEHAAQTHQELTGLVEEADFTLVLNRGHLP